MMFVDTGAWVAILASNDQNHAAAVQMQEQLAEQKRPLVTSNYILDETYTLLLLRVGYDVAILFHERLIGMQGGGILQVMQIAEGLQQKAWAVFERFNVDKRWSFTDCTSKVIMDEMGLADAFTFDQHFEQMGFVRHPRG